MKKGLFLLFLLHSVLSAQAEEYPYLTFQTNAGAESSMSIESLVLTVSDGKLLATNTTGTRTFTLSDLNKMYFSKTATGVASVERDDALRQPTEVYDMSGRRVAGAPLTKGVYIVKEQGKTRKIMVK